MGVFRKNTRRRPFRAKGRKQTLFRKKRRTTTLRRVARKLNALTNTIELKSGVQKYSDGLELAHNTLVVFSNTMLFTANGTRDR